MPLEIPEAIQPPAAPTTPAVGDRQARLDSILKGAALPPDQQQKIRDTFDQKSMERSQVEQFIRALPVNSQNKNDLWDTYYTYQQPKPAPVLPKPPEPPGFLTRMGNAAVDLIPTDKIRNMPAPVVPKVPAGVPEAAAKVRYDTKLTPEQETQFQSWKAKFAPNDSGEDYDLRGAFKAGLSPDPKTGHWPDTYKKPNHPTFSVESQYAKDAPEKAGRWNGDTYVPPAAQVNTPPSTVEPPSVMVREKQPYMSHTTPAPLPPPSVPFKKEFPGVLPSRVQGPLPLPQVGLADTLKGLPQALRTVRNENLKKSTWQAFRDTMGTIVGGAGGLLQGASLDYYEPEKGTLTLPRRLLNELVFQPQFVKTDKGWQRAPSAPDTSTRIHEPLSSVLQKDWGVPADLAQNGMMPDIGKFFGTVAPWSRVSSGISGALAGASELSEISAIAKIGAEGSIDAGNAKKAYSITKGILKNAGIQAATGEVIAHLEKPPEMPTGGLVPPENHPPFTVQDFFSGKVDTTGWKPGTRQETPSELEIRAAKTAMYGAAFSVLFDGIAHVLQKGTAALKKGKEGTARYDAAEDLDQVVRDIYDVFYRSGTFADEAAVKSAVEDVMAKHFGEGVSGVKVNAEALKESIQFVESERAAKAAGTPGPIRQPDLESARPVGSEAATEVSPVPEAAPAAPEVVPQEPAAAAPEPEVQQPKPKVKASAPPEIPSIPTPEVSAPIPSPTAEVEKPETPPKPVTPEALGIPAPKKQFTHDGQFVVGISDGKIVLADGSTVERAPSYIKTLGMFGYKELTPEQIGGLAGLAAANEKPKKAEVPEATPVVDETTEAGQFKAMKKGTGFTVLDPDGTEVDFLMNKDGTTTNSFDTLEKAQKYAAKLQKSAELNASVPEPVEGPENEEPVDLSIGNNLSIKKFASGEFYIVDENGKELRQQGSTHGHIPVISFKTKEEAQSEIDRRQKSGATDYKSAEKAADEFDDDLNAAYGPDAASEMITARVNKKLGLNESHTDVKQPKYKFTDEQIQRAEDLANEQDRLNQADRQAGADELEKRFVDLIPDPTARKKLVRDIANLDFPVELNVLDPKRESWRDVGVAVNKIAHYISENVTKDPEQTAFHISAQLGGTAENPGIQLKVDQERGLGPSQKTIDEVQRWLHHLYPENTPRMPGAKGIAESGVPDVIQPPKPKGTQELISGEDAHPDLGPRWTMHTGLDMEAEAFLDGEDEEDAKAVIVGSNGTAPDSTYTVETRDGRTAGPFDSIDQAASIAEQMFPQRGVGPKVPKRIKGPTALEVPPVASSHPLPEHPPGPRWTNDPGANPGEPAFFLDGKTEDDPNTKAYVVENDVPEYGGVNYSAHLHDGTELGPFASAGEAAADAEAAIDSKKGELPDVPATGTTESQGGDVHAEGATPTDGVSEATGNTEPGAGPESEAGTTDSGGLPGKGARSGRDARTGGRGTDAITRGGIDNSGFYRITDADELGSGGATTKFKDNLKAIRILKSLMAEERLPTPEERRALVRYVGWGGLSESAFNLYNRETREMAQELEKLLSPEEYEHARASTKNAHYTSAEVIRYIWNLAERMGFNGNGTILETSMGTGNFLGLAPDSAVKKGNFIGAELDPITGNIAKYLYPGAAIRIGGYETLMLPDNSVDLAIGNVPFGDYKIYDPLYKDLKLLIHDYFFIKTLDKIRPGGLVMFITSKGTLDKVNDRVRDLIADKANLVAAYRLPNTAFKTNARTEVTTDIIILQKRSPEDLRGGEPFMKLQEIGDDGIKVNEYFAKHPENMFGKMTLGGTMYRGNEPTLEPTEPLETLMAKALLSSPTNVMKAKPRAAAGKTPSIVDTVAPDTVKELAYTINGKGQLVQRIHGVLTKPQDAAVSNKLPQMKELIGIREQVKKVIAMQLQSSDDVPLKVEQEELSKLYDAYVKRHGFLSAKGSDIFSEDPQYPLLLALENYNRESKSATKSDIFEKRTIRPIIPLETVSSNPKEGLIQVLADRGFPDIPFLAQLSKQSEDDVVRSLEKDNIIFQNPGSGSFEMGPVYLSGYVRDKLEAAKHAAKQDPKYQRNVEALEAIQPAPIPIKDISVKLGATWVPQAAYQSFIREAILAGTGNHRTVKVTRLPDGAWDVEFQSSGDINLKWGSDYLSPAKIMESGMNMKRPTIWRDDGDGGKFVDQKATIAAREKLHLMKEEFQKWASSSPDWAEKLEGVYNKEYNGIRLMEYDGSHLTLPGISSEITLNPHQKNGVWRVITDGRALLAHVVGSGKTFTMIAAAMELKRLGISKKNLFVVPNGKVEQWRAMFQALYPAANILAVGRDDLAGDARRQSISRIATGDWDAVIVQHSSFGRIPISPERMARTIQNEMDELEETLRSSKAQGLQDRDPTIKALEKAKSRLEAHLKALQDAPKDNVINFDELGVDYMFVDELHEFKNLAYYTKMNNISGLGQKDAKKGLDLKSKTDYIQEKNRGRGVVGATGTPISNSMAEAYNMMRYVAPDVLTNAGIKFFDDWAANFGDVVEVMELSPDGRTYRARAKFSKFTNTPELMTMFRSFTDVKHAHELNLPTPNLKGGQPQPVKIRSNDVIEPIFQDLLSRAESLRANPSQSREKGSDNWLKLTGDGKKIALDARLFDADLPDHPDSKSNVAVSEIFKRYQGQKDTTQVVFADMYQDKTERFNLYKDMKQKLVEKGVPAKEIAIAHDFKNDDQLEKMQTQMNAGKIRILFGSTAKIGVGLNIQQKLSALHDLDAPWRPDQLEQRHGRIVRQGNKNKEVEILQYVTERSFDAYIFQALETKARFIRQIMSGQTSGRNIDDAAGDVVLQYAELKAIASGNPDVKRKIELETQIHRLDSLESSHLADEMRRKMKIRENEGRVADLHAQSSHLEDTKKLYEKYLANHIKQDKVTPFDAIVGGKDINDADEFVAYVDNNKDVTLRTGAVATIYGVPIKFETYETSVRELDDEGNAVKDGKGNSIWIKVPAYRYLFANAWEDIPNTGAAGLLLSLKHHLDRLGATIKQREEWAQESERQIKSIRAEMGKPFDHQEELDAARNELVEVDKRLAPPPETPAQDALLDVEDDPNAKRPEVGTTDAPNSPGDGAGQVGDIPPPVTGPSDLTKSRNAKLPNTSRLAIPKAPVTVGDKTYTSHIFPIARADGTAQSVSGWEIGPGLAVTDSVNKPGSFQILHTVSGLSVAQTFSAKQAISVAEKLLRLGDWTRSAEDFKTDTEFMNGVRAVVKLNESQRGSFSLFSKSAPPPIQPSLIPSPDKDMQQMASVQGPKKNIWEELKRLPADLKRLVTSGRYNEDIKDFPVFAERVRRAQEIILDAHGKAVHRIYQTLKGLHPTEYDVFRAIVLWEDMYETAARSGEQSIPLPGTNKLARIDAEITRLRNLSTTAVLDAVDRHHAWMEEIWDELVRRGKVNANDGRIKYFPNMIIHEFGDALNRLPGLPTRMQTPRRLYLKERVGHQTPHTADYIKVIEQYATRVYAHNMIDDFIDSAATENDQMTRLPAGILTPMLATTAGDLVPGHIYRTPNGEVLKGFQFNPGRILYPVNAINPQVILDASQAGLNELAIDIDAFRTNLPSTDLDTVTGDRLTRKAIALGGQHKTFLLPIEIADKLEHFRENNSIGPITEMIKAATQAWKVMAITFAGPSYHINNLIGDEITAYMEDIGSLAKQPEALRILKAKLVPSQYQTLVQMIEDARIWNSTFISSGDVGRAIDTPELRKYRQPSGLDRISPFGSNPIGDVWREYQRWSNIRESVPRVAKFLADVERVQKGEPVVSKGVALNGLDPRSLLAAGKVGREFNRDFGAVSPRMRLVYSTIFPFMSYHVGIVGPWLRRMAHKGKLFPGDEFLLKIVLPLVVLPLIWNHFMYPDVEEKLPDWQKEMRHINTPFVDDEGKPLIIAMEIPPDIVMRWGGLHTLEANFDRVATGQWTTEQAARQQLEDIFGHQDKSTTPTAPGAVMEQLLNPMIKVFMDLKANKDSFTGQQIVSTDSPNLWGDRSKAYPQTATGKAIYAEYIVKKTFSPYMQFLRASQTDNPDTPIWNWINSYGPFGWKKALGIRSVSPDAGARGDWYNDKNWNQALYDEKIQKITDAYVEFASGNINAEERDALIEPMIDQAGPMPTFAGDESDVYKIQQRPQFKVRVLQEMVRKEKDPETKQALQDKIKSLRYQVDKESYENTPEKVRKQVGLPPVPQP